MLRSISHFSIHRINSTDLRVVSNVQEGVLPVIEAEESVVRKFSNLPEWPHSFITLFILEDLQPLLRNLQAGLPEANSDMPRQNLSASEIAVLSERTLVNVYDLSDLTTCNIFVNSKEMIAQKYWGDAQAMRALMAHEHAHPLAENEITRVSRQISFKVLLENSIARNEQALRLTKMDGVLDSLGQKISLLAPREILTNEKTILAGFADDLYYLNELNMQNAVTSIAGRSTLVDHLIEEVANGDLKESEVQLLLLVGDLNALLPLALEIAPFYRAGKPEYAHLLEKTLETGVFPHLDQMAVKCYIDLRDHYLALSAGAGEPPDLMMNSTSPASRGLDWADKAIKILAQALITKGFALQYEMRLLEN